MTVKFKTVITKAGAEKLAAATVPNAKKVNFTAMAVGDGGGALPVPDASQTKLVNEVWRHALNKISQDKKNKNYVVAELLIPPEVGGFWMREMGLYDDTGTLIAVGNMAESYKPALAEGSGRAQTLRMVIMVSDISSVELTIDTSTVMATQEYVDGKLTEHEQSRRHPDATLTAKGFTQLSSATDSASEVLAATPKAVKAAYDLANGKYTAADATTARKGIVQLSSATDSVSEVLAATPKAVKIAYDLANAKYTAVDATTARKGLVQLSSAIDSVSEVLAATPKAVKLAYDLANSKYTAQDATTGRKGIVQLSNEPNSTSDVLAATPKAVSAAVKEIKATLGTASGANVVTSMTDTTAGRVPVVGWMGWGVSNSGSGCPTSGGIDYVSEATGIWQTTNENTTGTFPPNTSHYGTLFRMRGSANDVSQLYYPGASVANGGHIYFRQYNGVSMKWGSWYRIYSEFSKPTAGEVGAVAKTGDTMTGRLMINVDGEGVRLKPKTAGYASYIISVDSANTNHWYVGAGSSLNGDVTLLNYKGGNNSVTMKDDGTVYLNPTQGRPVIVNGPLQIGAIGSAVLNIGDNDSGLRSSVDGQVDLWSNNARVGYWNKTTFSFTGQMIPTNYANFDARYQAKGNYTPAGQAYTKAESDARYNLKNTASRAASGWEKDNTTGIMKQWGIATRTADSTRITFPTAFPTTCVSVQLTLLYTNGFHDQNIYVQNPDASGFTYIAGSGEVKVYFEARGY
ncbi:TPA: phage tail protein [Enterobacter cloacae]|nr:phage tail protein [Enterobacter cloacae]